MGSKSQLRLEPVGFDELIQFTSNIFKPDIVLTGILSLIETLHNIEQFYLKLMTTDITSRLFWCSHHTKNGQIVQPLSAKQTKTAEQILSTQTEAWQILVLALTQLCELVSTQSFLRKGPAILAHVSKGYMAPAFQIQQNYKTILQRSEAYWVVFLW